ncbi:hypothetical protein Poli38472_006144 [Pythium oligandrum]|uniref:Uncharacterized protein n=1 Tax=Pythium oligandrum TaxID=41045 RepID=A0A8K1CRV3_PYTOL|nr:hypothetical protein Poli38472_006144 [Pythium oligandrum]|eukprot:TMW68676.1 hypothetical protein Poli38472_006144 [Pythium oligandrum]
MATIHRLLVLATLLALVAIGDAGPTPPPLNGAIVNFREPNEEFCYRPMARKTNGQCPGNFHPSNAALCSMYCPLEYPIACGPVCTSYRSSCMSIGLSALGTHTVMGGKAAANGGLTAVNAPFDLAVDLSTPPIIKLLQGSVSGTALCALQIYKYFQEQKVPEPTPKPRFGYFDIRVVIASCMKIPNAERWTQDTDAAIDLMLKKLKPFFDKAEKANPDPKKQYEALMGEAEVKRALSIQQFTPDDTALLRKAMNDGPPDCGNHIRNVITKIADHIGTKRANHPNIGMNLLYEDLGAMDLVTLEVPAVAQQCHPNPNQQEQRDQLTSMIYDIMAGLVTAAYSQPEKLDPTKVFFRTLRYGLDIISIFDPTRITALVSKLSTRRCTANPFTPVDNGLVARQLGLKIRGTLMTVAGEWNNAGADGMVSLKIENDDNVPVKVTITSGGYKLYKFGFALPGTTLADKKSYVEILSKRTVTLQLPLTTFKAKNLRIIKEHPCLKDKLKAKAAFEKDSSVLLWVPPVTPPNKGHLELKVDIAAKKPGEEDGCTDLLPDNARAAAVAAPAPATRLLRA